MQTLSLRAATAVAVLAATALAAQEPTPPPKLAAPQHQVVTPVMETRMFTLDYLRPSDAAKLVSPFLMGEGGGVFDAGPNIRAITVRGTSATLTRVDSVLKSQDRAPATLTLRFQLIAALDSNVHDPAIADVDAALRGLFKFGGYRLVAQGLTSATESSFELSMFGGDEKYSLTGDSHAVGARAAAAGAGGRSSTGSAQLNVRLMGPMASTPGRGGAATTWGSLLSTGLTVPVGETIVIGNASQGTPGRSALILTVRTESSLASIKR